MLLLAGYCFRLTGGVAAPDHDGVTGSQVIVVPRSPASLMEDSRGALCRIRRVAGADECVHRYFAALAHPVTRIALEAGPLSQWLNAGLVAAGFETVLLETLRVKAALSAMTVKTDRHDGARSDRPLLRSG